MVLVSAINTPSIALIRPSPSRWSVGCQLMLANPLCTCAYAYKVPRTPTFTSACISPPHCCALIRCAYSPGSSSPSVSPSRSTTSPASTPRSTRPTSSGVTSAFPSSLRESGCSREQRGGGSNPAVAASCWVFSWSLPSWAPAYPAGRAQRTAHSAQAQGALRTHWAQRQRQGAGRRAGGGE
jgi:hypothetical protein